MQQPGKQPPSIKSVLGVVILLIAMLFVIFTGAQRFNEYTVEVRFKQFAEFIAQEAHKRGKEAKFTYGKISLEGWGYDKKAVVDNVSLEISEQALLDIHRLVLSTGRMSIAPDRIYVGKLQLVFADPINIAENSQPVGQMQFATPLFYSYFDSMLRGEHMIEHIVRFPNAVTFKDAKQADVTVTYEPFNQAYLRKWPERGETDMAYGFNNVKITGPDSKEATVASIASHLTQKPLSSGVPFGQYTLTIIDLMQRAGKPYSLSLDLEYQGGSATQGDTQVKINKLNLTGDDFKVKASGGFTAANDDPLPYGKIALDVSNIREFLTSDLVPAEARDALSNALHKASPDSQTDLSLPLVREKNGIFYIGKITFEEFTAAMLTHFMKSSPSTIPSQGTSDDQQIQK